MGQQNTTVLDCSILFDRNEDYMRNRYPLISPPTRLSPNTRLAAQKVGLPQDPKGEENGLKHRTAPARNKHYDLYK